MDWAQVLTIIGSNIALMGLVFGITIQLFLHNDKKIEVSRKETMDILNAIQQEMKDFHGRLCAIEERKINH